MNIITKYSAHGNIEQKFKDKQVHIITLAECGKSVFRTYGEFIGNISHEILRNYCDQANIMFGWITLYPLMNLSAIARKYFRKEMTEMDIVDFENIIRKIIKIDKLFIKSKHILFDFTCDVHNKVQIEKCLLKVAKEFENPYSEIEIFAIWLDNFTPEN